MQTFPTGVRKPKQNPKKRLLQRISSCFPEISSPLQLEVNSKEPINSLIDKLIENLPEPCPKASLAHMQKICDLQEQKITTKIRVLRNLDVFDEMNKFSDFLGNIKYMNQQELEHLYYESINKMVLFDHKCADSQMSIEEEKEEEHDSLTQFQVKFEENEETKSHSKAFYQHFLQSNNDSLIEKDENEDPCEIHDKKDFYVKMEDFSAFPGLTLNNNFNNNCKKIKKFPLDFNSIHNLLDEQENSNIFSPPRQSTMNELNILKEIDLNEGGVSNISNRLYE